MIFVEERATAEGNYYLKMLKKQFYVIRRLSGRRKFTIQQDDGARCNKANSVTNFLNENIPDYIKKDNWSLNSCDLNILDYAVWDMMKKMVYRNVK